MNTLYKTVQEVLSLEKEIPLFGNGAPLDWGQLEAALQTLFPCTLSAKGARWIQPKELPKDTHITPLWLFPLTAPIFWQMGHQDRETLLANSLQNPPKKKPLSSPLLQEGYYLFLLTKILQIVQTFEPLSSLTLQMGDPLPLPQEPLYALDIEMTLSSSPPFWGTLLLPASFRTQWVDHFSAFPQDPLLSPTRQKIPLSLSLEIGTLSLSPPEWKEIQVGDLLFYEPSCATKNQGRLLLQNHPLFAVQLDQQTLHIQDPITLREDFMEQEPFAAEESDMTSLQDVPLEISITLGKIEMSLEKLLSLQPGNRLELPFAPHGHVCLTLRGKTIAKGELLQIGDEYGIRITKI